MKQSEITKGKTYMNTEGQRRKVIDIMPAFGSGGLDVLYRLISTGRKSYMLLPNFAFWAKSEVKEGEDGP